MNLMFLNSIDEHTYGGMEEWIRLVGLGLTKRGHQVTVCGREKSEFFKRLRQYETKLELVGLDISGDFNPITISRIKREIQNRGINAIIVNFNKDIRLGGLAAKFTGDVRVIWSVGLDITKNNLVHKMLTPRLIDGVIVPSESLKNQIIRHGYIEQDLVKVIPIGIPEIEMKLIKDDLSELLRNRFSLSDDSKICVTCGRFVEQKGHTYLIEAALAIIRENKDVIFLFLGDGPLRTKLEEQINKLGLQAYFVFSGMLDNVAEVLAGCDLMIHPSIEEPFGIAILEGMRAGLPVVASKVGGIPEVVDEGKTGLLVEPGQPQTLASAVNKLLSSPELMNRMGESGNKRWANYFRYDKMIDFVEAYLNNQPAKARANGKA